MKNRMLLMCIGIMVGAIVLAPMIGYVRLGLMAPGTTPGTAPFLLIDFMPVVFGALVLLGAFLVAGHGAAAAASGVLVGIALYEISILLLYPPLTDGSLSSVCVVYGPALILAALASVAVWMRMSPRRDGVGSDH